MVSIESWRSSIGTFQQRSISRKHGRVNEGFDVAKLVFLCWIQTIMSAALINILLIRACIESNPGPISETSKGKLV